MRGGELLARAWLTDKFTRARGTADAPDGRPLWQWRCNELERQRMRQLLRPYLPPHDPPDRHQAAMFCLFATETLRRSWQGGPRSWSLVTDALGLVLSQDACRSLTIEGLRYWQRELRKGETTTQYLHSLVLEGGIPDALLTGDVEAFGRFLRAALADIEDFRAEDRDAALRQIAIHRMKLPETWRDDEILELAADLLLGIARVRQRTRHLQPEALLVWLETNPEWQVGLPLDIASDHVKKLLVSLVVQPRKQTVRVLSRLCHRVLVRCETGWRCAVVLESDGRLSASALASQVFADGKLTRARLFLDTGPESGVEIALLERESEEMVRFRPLQTRPLPVPWNDSVRVRLRCDGLERGMLALPGGDPLPDGSWIMEDDAQDNQEPASRLRIVGTGSRRTRLPELYLAVDQKRGQLTEASPSWLGKVDGTSRSVVRVGHPCFWHDTASGLSLHLAPGDNVDEEHPLALHPLRPPWTVAAPFVSLGPPGVAGGSGASHWRRPRQKKWQPLVGWPVGRLELAVIRNDVIWDTGEIVVLPRDASIKARRVNERRTTIEIAHLGPDVAVEGPVEIERASIAGRVCITVEWPDRPNPALWVRARLEDDVEPLRHLVRVPFGPGAIERDGVLLERGTQIRFADLSDCRAVSGGEDGAHADLVVRVQEGGASGRIVTDRIAFVDDEPLHRLQRRLLRQFATVGTKDANTRIHVERDGIGGHHVDVQPYGWTLRADAGRGTCTIVRNGGGMAVLDAANLVAVSVTRPNAAALPLLRSAAAWALPGPDSSDMWLVVGSGRCRGWFRPMLWVSGFAVVEQGTLSRLALITDNETRQDSYAQALQTIANGTRAEATAGLRYLLDLIRMARQHLIPALSLDALVAAARHRAIPIRLLWEADARQIQDVVELEDELPFLWCLFDPTALQQVVRNFLIVLGEAGLADTDAKDAADAKLTQLVVRCPQLAATCWVAREANGIPHSGNGDVSLAQFRQMQAHLHARVGVRRLTDQEWRRSVAATHDWQNFPEDVRVDAPAYAAGLIVTKGIPVDREIGVLRHLREQNPHEFDEVFHAAFLLAVVTTATPP